MRNVMTLAGMLLLLMAVAGCDRAAKSDSSAADGKSEETATAQTEEAEVVIPVEAELPVRGSISSYFETTTRVEAEKRVNVMAEGIGACIVLNVEEGDLVNAGDILAELDKSEIQATIGQTEVQVRQSKTSFDIAEKSLAEGIGSKAERDNSQFAYEQSLAALNMHKVQMDKLTIRAPIHGILTKRNIQLGQMVSAGAPVFSIVDPNSFMLAINPPEKELNRLKIGQLAKISIDALGGQEFDAVVRRINPNVDPLTGTVKVTLDIDQAAREKLRDSAFTRVRLVMETHENAILIPKDALVEENARKYVFVAQNRTDVPPASANKQEVPPAPAATADAPPIPEADKPVAGAGKDSAPSDGPALQAVRLEIETGLEDSNIVEVTRGIDDKSLIIVLGQHTLKSGAPISVANATDEIMSRADLSARDARTDGKVEGAGTDPSNP